MATASLRCTQDAYEACADNPSPEAHGPARGGAKWRRVWALSVVEMGSSTREAQAERSQSVTLAEQLRAELRVAYDDIIAGWARALDLRDQQAEGHSKRAAKWTVRLGQLIGTPEGELVHVYRGALLHDIGSMMIPDGILLKPGPLTAEEWQIIRRHPVYAYSLLSPISHLRPALDIPYCHHEKWDGTGYPRGLKGEQIPLAARIFSVVDVWDALCSDRPYRAAWTHEEAQEYICEHIGKDFDPQIVEAFLTIDLEASD
jgi:HD-GYP domain-containing protein (c-di-GMP phosphodiesterase class II)